MRSRNQPKLCGVYLDITEHMDRLAQSRMEVVGPDDGEREPFTRLGYVSCHVYDYLGDNFPQPDAKRVLGKSV